MSARLASAHSIRLLMCGMSDLPMDLEACPLPFHELSDWLKEQGEKRALDIHIQREEIFEAMHRI